MTENRFNVLQIMADQLAPHFLPNYGHPVVRAPRIAELSKNGVTFDNAYTNSPLCVPARAALETGKLPSTLGIYDSGGELSASIPTIAHYMRASGYHTCLSGKSHFIGPDQLHGFEDRLTSDMCMADFGMSGDWERGEEPLGFYHTMEAVANAGIAERAAQQDHDEEATYRATQWLYDWARQSDDGRRPFYMTFSLSQPHDPYVTPKRYWDRYSHDDIDLPTVSYVPVAEREPYSAWLYRHYDRGEYNLTEEHVRTARHAYYGNISYVDDLIGQVLDTIERIGQQDNTIVIFCSDHGEMLGERGQWYKMSPYEQSSRVPLIIKFPNLHAGKRVQSNVSLMDVAPTIMDMTTDGEALALSNQVDGMQGNSMRALLEGGDALWPDIAVSELMFEGRTEPGVMIRKGQYKYVHIAPGEALLFDMAEDPNEMVNLCGDAEYSEVISDFEAYISDTWDLPSIKKHIISDQRRRNFIQKTHYVGKIVSWDYQPFRDASNQYYRSHMTWLETEKQSMFRGG